MRPRPFLLLVDDDEDLLPLMALELQDDFRVLEASSYEQAVAQFNEARDVAAVVADLCLLPGRSGAELLDSVAHRAPECARLLISASPDGDVIHRALRDGTAHRFLRKPWSIGELRDAVTNARACAAARCSAGPRIESSIRGSGGVGLVARSASVSRSSAASHLLVLELAGSALSHGRALRRHR